MPRSCTSVIAAHMETNGDTLDQVSELGEDVLRQQSRWSVSESIFRQIAPSALSICSPTVVTKSHLPLGLSRPPDCRKPANANDYQLDYLVTIRRQ